MSGNIIGSLNEKNLHKNLKLLYSGSDSATEQEVDGYLIDIVTRGKLIEIQTGNFYSIKKKLSNLIKKHFITIVYPIAMETTIKFFSSEGTLLHKRKSPKKQSVKNAVSELIYIPELLLSPKINIEVVLIKQEEIRLNDGKGSWKRKGISIGDKKITDIVNTYIFADPSDYVLLLPKKLPEIFGNKEISEGLKNEGVQGNQCKKLAGQISYLLRKLGVIKLIGKERNRLLFELTP